MKSIVTLAAAAAIAFTAFATAATPAAAGKRDAVIFGAIGLGTGIVIGSQIRSRPVVVHNANVRAHYRWCAARYISYDAPSNTWIDKRGRVRNCASPFGG